MKVTNKKKIANRANARKSTGPRTVKGKSAVALNGVVHGLRSLKPVLPGLEDAKDWEKHRDVIIGELAPEGAIEAAFAERIALGFWRQARCTEAEGRISEASREKAKWRAIQDSAWREDYRKGNEAGQVISSRLEKDCSESAHIAHLWEQMEDGKAGDAIDPDIVDQLIEKAITAQELSILWEAFDQEFVWPPTQIDQLRKMMEWFAEKISKVPKKWMREQAKIAKGASSEAVERMERIRLDGRIAEDLTTLDSGAFERVTRYETTTHRALLKDLHELQRLQTLRNEGKIPAPIVLDITTSA
jgi:hypothetical protein